MNHIKKDSIREFCDYVDEKYNFFRRLFEMNLDCLSIVAEYDILIDIINDLLKRNGFSLAQADISPLGYGEYHHEYVCSIDWDGKISVEQAYSEPEGVYLGIPEGIALVYHTCDEQFYEANSYVHFNTFEITDFENDESDDASLQPTFVEHLNDEGAVTGFSEFHIDENGNFLSHSFYSDNEDLVKQALNSLHKD